MKKLFALHDSKGRILAAVLLDGNDDERKPRPVPRRGQKTIELELLPEHLQFDLPGICTAYRVDFKLKRLVTLKSKKLSR